MWKVSVFNELHIFVLAMTNQRSKLGLKPIIQISQDFLWCLCLPPEFKDRKDGVGIVYVKQNAWTLGIPCAKFMNILLSSLGRIHKKPDQHFLKVLKKLLKNGNVCCMCLKTASLGTYILSKGTNALKHKAITSANKSSKYL